MEELIDLVLYVICSVLSFFIGKYFKQIGRKTPFYPPIRATEDSGLLRMNVIYRALVCPSCGLISAPYMSNENGVEQIVICVHCKKDFLVKASTRDCKYRIIKSYKSSPNLRAITFENKE